MNKGVRITMKKLQSIFLPLFASDFLVIIFATFLSILNLIFYNRVEYWDRLILFNIIVVIFVIIFAHLDKKFDHPFWTQLHYWYIVPLIFISYKELYFMVEPIRHVDYDKILIAIDRFIFGQDPTKILYHISTPVLTELLQITYGTFFFLPVILAVDLMLKNRMEAVKFEIFLIVYGFFLSYIGYFLVPAIGPRFTLYNFRNINAELPGLFFTNYIREILNFGESITAKTLNPTALVQRDVFPSGHTEMTLLVMYLSVKFKAKTKYFFLPVGTLLIFSTVYLRYHYAIDVIGGIAFMIFAVWSGKKIYNWWMNITNNPKFEYNKY